MQCYQLYCVELKRRGGHDFAVTADMKFLETETMTAAEWAAHMVTAGSALHGVDATGKRYVMDSKLTMCIALQRT